MYARPSRKTQGIWCWRYDMLTEIRSRIERGKTIPIPYLKERYAQLDEWIPRSYDGDVKDLKAERKMIKELI